MNKYFLPVGIIAVAFAGVWYFSSIGFAIIPISNSHFFTTSTPISKKDWGTYVNTKYHYSIKYPETWVVAQAQEEERSTIEESSEVIIEYAGNVGVVGVTIFDPSLLGGSTDPAVIAFKKTISANLHSFAEVAWQKEKNGKNPNFPNKKVGELQEVTFSGEKAFSYMVTDSMDGYGGTSDRYLFLEKNNIKYKVYYSLNVSLPQEIANTFEFTN